jgi:ATP-binding cassette subfamily B protein
MRNLIRYLGKYKWMILFAMLLAAGSTVFSIFGPRTLGQATTELYLGVQRMVQNDPLGIDFPLESNFASGIDTLLDLKPFWV